MSEAMSYSKKEVGIISTVTVTSILPLLDGSIVNVIIARLATNFSVGEGQIQWVVTAYFLSGIIGLLLSSALQGRLGVKYVWILSSLIFMFGSLCAGLSNSFTAIVASRVIQGLGAGLLLPLSQTIIATAFGKDRMKSVIGLVAVPAVFAPAVGPLLGAFFADYLSWRLLFLINVPLVLLSLLIGCRCITIKEKDNNCFGFIPFILFSLSLCLFFWYVDKIKSEINAVTLAMVMVSVLLFIIAFKVNADSENKLIEFGEFRKKNYAISMFMGLVVSFLFYSFMVFFPLASAFQGEAENGSLILGVLLGLQGVGAWLSRKYLLKKLNDFSPFWVISLGVFISTVSILFINLGPGASAFGFLLRGVGLGVATIVCLSAPMQWAEQRYIKDTSVITRLLQQLGGAAGGIFSGSLVYLIVSHGLSIQNAYIIFFCLSAVLWGLTVLGCHLTRQQG